MLRCFATSPSFACFAVGCAMLRAPAVVGCLPGAAQRVSIGSNAAALRTARRWFMGGGRNPYTILGIKQGADKKEIKKAYRIMAAKFHPDAPGGSNEKFQEIQAAYEEIKTGVWIPKNADGSDAAGAGGGSTSSKYGGFQWYTDGKRGNKMSYDRMQQRMHQGTSDKTVNEFDDDEYEEPKSKFKNPMGASDQQVQAWFRMISSWAAIFVFLRVVLFLFFPPKHQAHPKKPLPPRPRRPPPPKPVQHSPVEEQ